MVKIEIIAIEENKFYSVGMIEVNKKGDVYLFHKNKHGEEHTSRHASGEVHMQYTDFRRQIRKGIPIDYFKGIEFLEVCSFGMQSLAEYHNEYEIKKYDGLFAIDMRQYKNTYFNLSFAIFTDESIGDLYKNISKYKKSQLYLYTDCHPKIAICAFDARNQEEKG